MMLYESYSGQAEKDRVMEVLNRGQWWLNGEEVEQFENKVADASDRDYAVSFNSGTTALYTALVANDIRGEVIVPSFTYPGTVNAVIAAGCEPVFADIESETMGLDAESVADSLTQYTRAIIPVHFSGLTCADIYEIVNFAHYAGVEVIEDNAHSFGAEFGRKKAGSFGDAAMLSFSFNKVITTGTGGMLVTDSEYMASRFKQYRSQGKNENGEFKSAGLNFTMSSINAAIGIAQMGRMDWMITHRRRLASIFDQRIKNIDDSIEPVPRHDRQQSVHQRYNVLLDSEQERDKLRNMLNKEEIPTTVSYEPCHRLDHFKQYKSGDMSTTNDISSRILTIPFHINLDISDINKIMDAMRGVKN